MRFTSILSSALLAATTLAAPSSSSPPSSTDLDSIPSVAQAKAHGVDPFGPIPDGATKLPNGGYSAKPDTQAWYWIVAQLDIVVFTTSHPSSATKDVHVERRQLSPPIDLAIFEEPDCRGEIFFFPTLPYDIPMTQPMPIPAKSVGLFGRPLFSNEKLEFRRHSATSLYCGDVISSIGPNSATGCYPVDNADCFRLVKD